MLSAAGFPTSTEKPMDEPLALSTLVLSAYIKPLYRESEKLGKFVSGYALELGKDTPS